MSNPFKLAAQRKRAMALVAVIDAALPEGTDIIDQAGKVVMILIGWTEKDWANAARVAKLETIPSEDTRELVRGFYRQRANAALAPMVMQ